MSTSADHRSGPVGALRGVGLAFLSIGVAIALFCGYVFWGSNVTGDQAAAHILERASQQLDQPESSESSPVVPPTAQAPSAQSQSVQSSSAQAQSVQSPSAQPSEVADSGYAPGDVVGVVSVPSIDLKVAVLEGMDADVLDQGVLGHYPGTAIPGSVGNFAIAGHRTTYGAPLYDIDQIAVGDPIVVQTTRGWDVYAMDRQRIVDPEAVEVLAPVPDYPQATATERWMVLTSCHPKLSAEKRIVVYAIFDRHVPRDQGPPEEFG